MDEQWFVAEELLLSIIGGEDDLVLENNFILIKADTWSDAVAEANRIGKEKEMEYTNTDGATVKVRFLGLRNLHFCHDGVEHGAELMWDKLLPASVAEAQAMVSPVSEYGGYEAAMRREKSMERLKKHKQES